MTKRAGRGALLALLLMSVSFGSRVEAQSPPTDKSVYVPSGVVEKTTDKPQGWSYAFTLAANLNVASNHDVVGQVEGNSFLFGASALLGADYLRGRHELLNTASLVEAWSRTPSLDRFVKSNDLLDLQSIYNFFLTPWTGPFARLALQTGLLKTDRNTAQPVTYTTEDGQGPTVTTSRLRLSDSFQPFTIAESLGWFVQPLRSEPLNLYGRAGIGGRHTFADGARAITDSSDEPTNVTYQLLRDVHQGGVELFAGFDGKHVDGRLLYSAALSVLFPIINNDEDDRSIAKLTRVALSAALGMSVVSWLSVNYQLKVIRDVQLVDAVQIQNSLLLSLQYAHSSLDAAKAKAKAEKERQEAEREARFAELEARVVAAEERARAAEERVTPNLPAPSEPAPLPIPPGNETGGPAPVPAPAP